MKNMIKRIIVGVAIGTILFIIKGGNVFAACVSQSQFDLIEFHYKFDLCVQSGDSVVCTPSLEGTTDLKQHIFTEYIYKTKSNEYLALKEFDVNISMSGSNVIETSGNGFNLLPPEVFFTGLNGYSIGTIESKEQYYNKTRINQFITEVQYSTNNGTDWTTQPNGRLGQVYGTGQFSYNGSTNYYYNLTPWTHLGVSRRITDLKYKYQSGYTYSGSNDIFSMVPLYSSSSSMPNINTYVNNNKSNAYLGVVFPNSTLRIPNYNDLLSGIFSMCTGSNSSVLLKSEDFPFTDTDASINSDAAYINKEFIMSSSFIGSDTPSSEQFNNISSSINTLSSGLNSSLSTFGFQDFLSALIQKPITELQFMIRNENVGGDNNMTIACPTIYLPFKVDHTTGTNIYGMYLPCMSDLYYSIPYVGKSGDTLGQGSLIGLYQTVLTGFLTYLLVLSWLNIIKHTITNSPSEIEVYEL